VLGNNFAIQGDKDSINLFILIVNMFGSSDSEYCVKKDVGKKHPDNLILFLNVSLFQRM